MNEMINLLNSGACNAASLIYAELTVKEVKDYMMNDLGWSVSKALHGCACLMFPSKERHKRFLEAK